MPERVTKFLPESLGRYVLFPVLARRTTGIFCSRSSFLFGRYPESSLSSNGGVDNASAFSVFGKPLTIFAIFHIQIFPLNWLLNLSASAALSK